MAKDMRIIGKINVLYKFLSISQMLPEFFLNIFSKSLKGSSHPRTFILALGIVFFVLSVANGDWRVLKDHMGSVIELFIN